MACGRPFDSLNLHRRRIEYALPVGLLKFQFPYTPLAHSPCNDNVIKSC